MKTLLHRPLYFLSRAFEAMARGPQVAMVATATIFVAVLVTGLFATVLHGAGRLLETWSGEVEISVYLKPEADLEAARQAAAAAAPGRRVEAVSAREALQRFRASLGNQAALLDGVGDEVLPPSVEVHAPGIRLAEARALASRLMAVPGAAEVDFGNAWLERLERVLRHLRLAGLALLVVLGGGAAVLVANTLRLGVLARSDEIEIMKLVGATDAFVEIPFFIEGFLQGLFGGSLAALTLLVAALFGLPRLEAALGLSFPLARGELFPPSLFLGLSLGGAALGLVASALSVRRELGRA